MATGTGLRRDGASGGGVWAGSAGDLAGGGLSIPYREGEEAIDTDHYYGLWNAAREQIARHLGHPVKLEIEPGRFLVAESGVLVSQVRSVKEMGSRHFVLIDAGFNDLMRPSMYGSYHHITALAADGRNLSAAPLIDTVVAGPLCESGDVFTQQEGARWRRVCCLKSRREIIWCCMIRGLWRVDVLKLQQSSAAAGSAVRQRRARLIRRRQTIQELLALELF